VDVPSSLEQLDTATKLAFNHSSQNITSNFIGEHSLALHKMKWEIHCKQLQDNP